MRGYIMEQTTKNSGNTKPINCFPGYYYTIEWIKNKKIVHNMYRDVDLGMGGYIVGIPGIWRNVAVIDAASMHPSSIIAENKLGKYTQNYKDLKDARILIKHHNYEEAGKLFDGKFKKYLTSEEEADALSTALKLPLNSFYGVSFASFKNPAKDSRDENNIIALRGALFMKTLQDEVESRGFKVIAIRTDSIKIPDATESIIKFIQDFGKKYGYEMEHEATYDRMCLVNESAYIALYDDKGIRNKGGKHANEWTATAKQFQVPYVFKTLFSHEEIIFEDMCETFSVKEGSIYIDFNENLPDVSEQEKLLKKLKKDELAAESSQIQSLEDEIANGHNYQFIGNVGQFTPIKSGNGGGTLYRIKDGVATAVQGSKGYRWMESEAVKLLGLEDKIDRDYYRKLVDDAVASISEFGDFERVNCRA